MKNERLIINLIQQDLKHNQLLSGLERIGLDGSDFHYLRILDIVSELMKVPEQISDDWGKLYIKFMEQAIQYKMTSRGETLKPLAEVCYNQLNALIETKSL